MGILDRFRKQKSASTDKQVALNSLLDFLGIDRESCGDALSEITYYACLKTLSESVGKLPLKIQQAQPNQGIRVARDHRWYRALNERPNRYMTASTFWGLMETCRNHYGNAYAWIDSRDPKRPQLWHIDPNTVQVWYDDACLLHDAPDLYYLVSSKRGEIVLGSEEVLHFKSHLTLDGLVGISVRERLASTIQGNIKAQKMLNKLYDNSFTSKSVLQYTGGLKDANVEALVRGMEAYAKGEMKSRGVENIIPVPFGMTLTPLNLKLTDSQFLEIRQYTALQIASAFGIKPAQIGDYSKSSYASAEAQQLSFLTDTLLFILSGYEQEIGYKLLSDSEEASGYHAKFNTGVLLRSDQKSQIDTLVSAVSNFIYTPNEAREKLDLPAREGGDKLIGNGSTVPLDQLGIQWQQTQQAAQDGESDDKKDEEKPKGDQQADKPDDHKDSARKEDAKCTKRTSTRRKSSPA